MTITREQVADLQPGDVVELVHDDWPEGSCWRGPIYYEPDPGWLYAAGAIIRDPDGDPRRRDGWHLTVVSRAPRPLYVNHDRTEPVPGDVVRDADSDDARTWTRNAAGFSHEWLSSRSHNYEPRSDLPNRLRLLVDGETGRCVP